MKKLILILMLTTIILTAQEPIDTDGNGYRNISTLEQLRWISENDSSCSWNFELDNDIDASDTRNWNIGDHDDNPETPDSAMGWKPIGTEDIPYTGNFNGNGYAIDGLYINIIRGYDCFAFFSFTDSSVISNLKMTNCELNGKYVSAIVGVNRGVIKNCFSSGILISKYGSGYGTAGIASVNYNLIDNCISESVIIGNSYAGGIASYNEGEIRKSSYIGKMNVSYSKYCGGIVARNFGLVINCNTDAELIGYFEVGGIAGRNFGFVSACRSSGSIKGHNRVGGICGNNFNSIKNSFSDSYTEAVYFVGGIAGKSNRIINCYSFAKVKGDSLFGALTGDSISFIINSYWNTDSTDYENFSGGLGKTTEELKDKSTFNDWNFDYVWAMDTLYPYININYDYALKDTDNNGYYEINDVSDFEWMSETGLNCNHNIELTNNINMSKSTLYDDAFGFRSIPLFEGNINGNKFVIDSLRINSTKANYVGIFSKIYDSNIENLQIKNAIINGKKYVGIFAGEIENTNIKNCKIDGEISCISRAGCIAGIIRGDEYYIENAIDSCEINIEIEGEDHIGGLAGSSYYVNIINSRIFSKVKGTDYVGGVSGEADINFYNNKINTKVEGIDYVGGAFGKSWSISKHYKNCIALIDIKGNDFVGGLIGESNNNIDSCSVSGNVTGNEYVGGIVGVNSSYLTSSKFDGNVTGKMIVGGISGYNYFKEFDERGIYDLYECHSNAIVIADSVVGGLIGFNPTGAVYKCYTEGKVEGISMVGGIIGYIHGFPYLDYYNLIENCYSRCDVYGTDQVGGISGFMDGIYNEIINCYSTGTVNGKSNIGGFLGENSILAFVKHSFWDTETSQIDSSAGGTGRSTKEMKTKSTFTDAGWDFDEIWFISEDVNDGYPALFGLDNPPTSVNNEMINDDDLIRISPNPAVDYIEITINKPSEGLEPSEGSEIEIYDLLGERVIYSTQSLLRNATPCSHPDFSGQEGNFKIDVSQLPKGVYFVRMGDRFEKFVKM